MQSGKPIPPLRYSSVVHELEREFPQSPPEDIHEMAGKRLKEITENRDPVGIGKDPRFQAKDIAFLADSPISFASSSTRPKKRKFKASM